MYSYALIYNGWAYLAQIFLSNFREKVLAKENFGKTIFFLRGEFFEIKIFKRLKLNFFF